MAAGYEDPLPACGLTTRDADEVVLKMRAAGETYRVIAHVLGVSISRARCRHKDAERRRGVSVFTPSQIAQWLEYRKMMEEDDGF